MRVTRLHVGGVRGAPPPERAQRARVAAVARLGLREGRVEAPRAVRRLALRHLVRARARVRVRVRVRDAPFLALARTLTLTVTLTPILTPTLILTLTLAPPSPPSRRCRPRGGTRPRPRRRSAARDLVRGRARVTARARARARVRVRVRARARARVRARVRDREQRGTAALRISNPNPSPYRRPRHPPRRLAACAPWSARRTRRSASLRCAGPACRGPTTLAGRPWPSPRAAGGLRRHTPARVRCRASRTRLAGWLGLG